MKHVNRRIRWAVAIFFASTAGAAAYVGWMFVGSPYSRDASRLDAETRRARSLGLALTLSDLNVGCDRPDNAGKYLEAAADQLGAQGQWTNVDGLGTIKEFAHGLGTGADEPKMRKVLDISGPALESLRKAVSCSRCAFTFTVDPIGHILPPHQVDIRNLAWLELAVGAYCLGRHREDEALRAFAAAFRIAAWAADIPFTDAWSNGAALQIDVMNSTFAQISRYGMSRRFVARLSEVARFDDDMPSLRDALLGVLVVCRAEVQAAKQWADLSLVATSDEVRDNPELAATGWPGFGLFLRATEAKTTAAYTRLAESLPASRYDWRGIERDLIAVKADLDRDQSLATVHAKVRLAPAMIMPRRLALLIAWRRMFACTLKLELLDRLPATLPPGSDSIDPFTDKPMSYRPIPAGFEIGCDAGPTIDDPSFEQGLWFRRLARWSKWRVTGLAVAMK